MDVVLELCDKFVFDQVYATLLPLQPSSNNFNAGVVNSTASDLKVFSSWKYQPATTYVSFPPNEAAYMSHWSRDNIWRQLITLYVITW